MKKLNRKEKKKTPVRVSFDILGYGIFIIVFILVCIVGIQSMTGQHPNLFGYCYYYIETGSMEGENEDSIAKNTIILSKMIDEDDCYSLKVGDIITFNPTDPNLPTYVTTKTHRIIEIDYDNQTIITQGDASLSKDTPISFEDVEAKFIKKSPLVTFFYNIIRSFWGFLFLIFIPLSVLIVIQICSYFLEKKKIELKEQIELLEEKQEMSIEEQKKKIEEEAIKEYLNSMRNEKK